MNLARLFNSGERRVKRAGPDYRDYYFDGQFFGYVCPKCRVSKHLTKRYDAQQDLMHLECPCGWQGDSLPADA